MKGKELWILLLAAAMLSGAMGSGVLALEEESPAELEAAQTIPVQTGAVPPAEAASAETAPPEAVAPEAETGPQKDVVLLEQAPDLEQLPLLVNLWNPLPEDYTVELEKLEGGAPDRRRGSSGPGADAL